MYCVIDNFNNIFNKITSIREKLLRLNPDCEIMAVIKYASKNDILEVIKDGRIKILGENRVQDAIKRWEEDHQFKNLRNKIELHFIGHLQKNKVKHAINIFDSIDCVDSIELAKEINKRAGNKGIKIPVMLQLKINERDTQYGIKIEDFNKAYKDISEMDNISIRGIMAIGPITDNEEEIARAYQTAKKIYSSYFKEEKNKDGYKNYLSLGMSSDWEIAVKNGSNLIRIGSYFFEKGEKV